MKRYRITTSRGRLVGEVQASNHSAAIIKAIERWPALPLGYVSFEGFRFMSFESFRTEEIVE